MRGPLIAITLCCVSTAVCAQSANGTVEGLESCFRMARSADLTCSSSANDAAQRLDCLRKARRAQLECLEHVPPEASAGSVRRQMSAGKVRPDLPTATVSPELAARSGSSEPDASVAAGATISGPGKLSATIASEKPVAAVSPDLAARTADSPSRPQDTNWVVSETTSPVDYSPLVMAMVRSPSKAKDAPKTLAIRCRGQRTELEVRTEGTWRESRAGEIQVTYQINDQPIVRLPWTLSADGNAASYRNDAAELLQSLPEGARLRIDVLDGTNRRNEATFQLAGWGAVREKLAAACKWMPMAGKLSSGQR
ncbi:MAG: type VI secretion system-associated protein TagO [Bradyrhizobium sp.]